MSEHFHLAWDRHLHTPVIEVIQLKQSELYTEYVLMYNKVFVEFVPEYGTVAESIII